LNPIFAGLSPLKDSAWGVILEKAWAKVKGNYM
jgi:hypothetical protein